jgi:predicted kinase
MKSVSARRALLLDDLDKKIQAEMMSASAKTKVAEQLVAEIKGHHLQADEFRKARKRLIIAPSAGAMTRVIGGRANG